MAHRAWRAKILAAGFCWRCPAAQRRPCAAGRKLCNEHVDGQRQRTRERHESRGKDGTCMDCPKHAPRPAVAGWRCREHADKEAARRRTERAQRAKTFLLYGERLTLREISQITGWAEVVLNGRMAKGMAVEDAAFPVRSDR